MMDDKTYNYSAMRKCGSLYGSICKQGSIKIPWRRNGLFMSYSFKNKPLGSAFNNTELTKAIPNEFEPPYYTRLGVKVGILNSRMRLVVYI